MKCRAFIIIGWKCFEIEIGYLRIAVTHANFIAFHNSQQAKLGKCLKTRRSELFILPSANEIRKVGTQNYNFTFFVGFCLKVRKKKY
jgi:hypothetical protein